MKRLTLLVHGEAGSGKSWLADTCPGPRLLLDAEGRSEFTPSAKAPWNPRDALPTAMPDGSPISKDSTVVAEIRSYGDLTRAKQWLDSGQHPFKSVILDSITDVQEQLLEEIVGDAQAQMQDWGTLFRKLNGLILGLKDLRRHPTAPLDMIVVLAGTAERDGRMRAYVQGQLGKKLVYRFDVVGYLTVENDAATSQEYRRLSLSAAGHAEAKDGTGIFTNHYGPSVINPDLSQMLEVLNTPATTEVTP